MKRINIVLFPLDGRCEIVMGYLFGDSTFPHAMFIDNEGAVNLIRVRKTELPEVFTQSTGHVVLGQTDRGDIAIRELIDKLNAMTAAEFLRIHIVDSESEISFDLVRE